MKFLSALKNMFLVHKCRGNNKKKKKKNAATVIPYQESNTYLEETLLNKNSE